VRELVVDGDVAYFGGRFAAHNGLDQRGLGAVGVSSGEPVPGFDVSTDGPVYALAVDGSRLFVGGKFTAVDGQPRDALASVDLSRNALDAWHPERPCGGCNVQWDVLVDGGTVYVSGRNAGAVTAFNANTAARTWRVTANGDAQALALFDGLLYAGGHFVEIGDPRQPRTILAALDPDTGAIDPDFRPQFRTTWPGIWALAATSTRLYAGGHFTATGPTPPRQHPYFAMFGALIANRAPTARAAADPEQSVVGEEITFSAAGSDDAETPDDLEYAWDFGNGGGTTDATGEVVHHTYPRPGRYTATVTVTDPDGASDTAARAVRVNEVVACRAAQVRLGDGWRVKQDDRANDGHYCASDGPQGGRDVASFTFRGPWVTVLHGDALRGGTAHVSVDGERMANLSFQGDTRRIQFLQQRRMSGLGAGRHTLRIEVVRKTGVLEGFAVP
jgi:PKD repeat protein